MIKNNYNDPKNSLVLFELGDKLDFLIKLHSLKRLPKVLMISGNKGIGKFTLVNHFLSFIFDQDNYDLKNKTIDPESKFYKQHLNNSFSNIIYLAGDSFQNVKIDDIRDLKSTILKSSILAKERFIILDDVELFNINSLNALLKIIEEPSLNNYFILINNKTKPLIETIHSRSLELKISLNNDAIMKIIERLVKKNNIQTYIDPSLSNLTPGSFLIFNKIFEDNKIDIDQDFLKNLELILNLYKKTKNKDLIKLILFLADRHFYNLQKNKIFDIEKNIENKSFVMRNLNKYILYNFNQSSLINAINNKLSNG